MILSIIYFSKLISDTEGSSASEIIGPPWIEITNRKNYTLKSWNHNQIFANYSRGLQLKTRRELSRVAREFQINSRREFPRVTASSKSTLATSFRELRRVPKIKKKCENLKLCFIHNASRWWIHERGGKHCGRRTNTLSLRKLSGEKLKHLSRLSIFNYCIGGGFRCLWTRITPRRRPPIYPGPRATTATTTRVIPGSFRKWLCRFNPISVLGGFRYL